MVCKICGHPTSLFAKATVLGKYNVSYYHCGYCGFIQPEAPYWLDEAYSEAIAASDVGLVQRNWTLAKKSQGVINTCFDPNGKFLDYGGGYGLFVRLMRDYGLDFYRYDKYCANLFALGFDDHEEYKHQYELITAFEVFEHLTQPMAEIAQMLKFSKNILFSTTLIPPNTPKPGGWWYYTLDTGQHVSLYSRKSLEVIADKFDLNLASDGTNLHLLTEKKVSSILFNLISRYKVSVMFGWLHRRKTLLFDDYQRALNQEFE